MGIDRQNSRIRAARNRQPRHRSCNFFRHGVFYRIVKTNSAMSSIAFCGNLLNVFVMRRAAALAIAIALIGGGGAGVSAQDATNPPPAPVPAPSGEPEGDGARRPPRGEFDGRDRGESREGRGEGRGGFSRGGDRERMESFKKMSEEERRIVRDAFEKAWKNPDVTAARERYMKANDVYRETLHKALQEADPQAVVLLEKFKPKGPPGAMPMPDPGDPEFARKAVMRLGMELHALSRAENRGHPSKEIHMRLMERSAVRDAVGKLEAAAPGDRMEAWKQLVQTYQTAARAELPVRTGDANREGPRRDGPPGPPRGVGPGAEPR